MIDFLAGVITTVDMTILVGGTIILIGAALYSAIKGYRSGKGICASIGKFVWSAFRDLP